MNRFPDFGKDLERGFEAHENCYDCATFYAAFARYIVDREEGKAAEHLILDNGADLSDEECDELRKLIQGKHPGDGRDTDR
jgi:hypothetical protein